MAIAGVGLCHTDLAVRHGHLPFPFPAVLGHEGSGTVTAIGHAVTKVAPGDKVVLSFNSCGICPQCKDDAPGYCPSFAPLNFGGGRVDGTSPITRDGAPLGSEFFGQSSFASHAIAHERNVVKVADDAPLELLGPLGCGVQTGAGSVLNSLDCSPAAPCWSWEEGRSDSQPSWLRPRAAWRPSSCSRRMRSDDSSLSSLEPPMSLTLRTGHCRSRCEPSSRPASITQSTRWPSPTSSARWCSR